MKLVVHTDGGSRGNPGPAASAFIISDSTHKVIVSRGVYLGITTNNQAEYLAVANALVWLNQHLNRLSIAGDSISGVSFFLDSELVVNQLTGKYKIKSPKLSQIISQINTAKQKLPISVNFQYIPREQNKAADKLVNQVLDSLCK